MNDNYHAWDIKYEDFFAQHSSRDRIAFLVRFAVLAPSSHNSQPWKFEIHDDAIVVFPEPRRTLPISDPLGRHLHISIGCALENMVIAANYYGLLTSIDYLPSSYPGAAALITVSFPDRKMESLQPDNHLAHAIVRRRVNRNPYTDEVLPESFLASLRGLGSSEACVGCVADPKERAQLADLLIQSRIEAFAHDDFREEMARYKRNNLTASPIGITGITMGFGMLQSFIAPFAIKFFNVMKLIRKSEERLLKDHTPAFVLIGSRESSPKGWMEAGRVTERVLLEAERGGFQTSISAVPKETSSLQKIFKTDHYPQMILRIGRAKDIPPHSPRLRADQVSRFVDRL